MTDRTWPTVRHERCIHYRRPTGVLIVLDRLKAVERSKVVQRWQIPPDASVVPTPSGAQLLGDGAARSLIVNDAARSKWRHRRARSGNPNGWFTLGYGQLERGGVLSKERVLERGQRVVWKTTLQP